jgi:hypothetical protein
VDDSKNEKTEVMKKELEKSLTENTSQKVSNILQNGINKMPLKDLIKLFDISAEKINNIAVNEPVTYTREAEVTTGNLGKDYN